MGLTVLQIDELILEGVGAEEHPIVLAALRRALIHLIERWGLPAGLTSGALDLASLSVPPLDRRPGEGPAVFGGRIATALHGALPGARRPTNGGAP